MVGLALDLCVWCLIFCRLVASGWWLGSGFGLDSVCSCLAGCALGFGFDCLD